MYMHGTMQKGILMHNVKTNWIVYGHRGFSEMRTSTIIISMQLTLRSNSFFQSTFETFMLTKSNTDTIKLKTESKTTGNFFDPMAL